MNKNSSVIQRASAIFLLSAFVMIGALTFTDLLHALMIVVEAVPLIVIGVLLFFEAFADTQELHVQHQTRETRDHGNLYC